MRDLRFAPQYKCDLRSSGMLRSVYWSVVIDVSGQPIDLVLKGQGVDPWKLGPIGCSETSVTDYQ